jgi:hypothetical protein
MSVEGKWRVVIDSPIGKMADEVELRAEGGKLVGSMSDTGIFDGSVRGNDLTFKAKKAGIATLTFTLSVDGNVITGQCKAGILGTYPVFGERI